VWLYCLSRKALCYFGDLPTLFVMKNYKRWINDFELMKEDIMNKKIYGKKFIMVVICIAMIGSSISASAAAKDEKNEKKFTGVVLPETSGNATLCAGKKSTSIKYAKVKISTYKNCKKVSCWMRSELSDGYHYWLPYMVDISDKKYHKVKYCDAKSSYYAAGVKVDVRAENADEELNLKTEKVSGSAYLN